jgi:hypothetical protein
MTLSINLLPTRVPHLSVRLPLSRGATSRSRGRVLPRTPWKPPTKLARELGLGTAYLYDEVLCYSVEAFEIGTLTDCLDLIV